MTDDFTRYHVMRQSGALPEDVYRAALRDGVDSITRIRLIRVVCSLSLGEAKEVILRAEGKSATIGEFQEKIADTIEQKLGRSVPSK